MSPLVAQSGHHGRGNECLLLGVMRTFGLAARQAPNLDGCESNRRMFVSGSGSCLNYSVADHQAVDQMRRSSLCAVDFAKLKRTYNEKCSAGPVSCAGSCRGLDFLDREQPRRVCEVLIAVATALGEARSGCATPPLFSLRVWLC